MRRVKNKLAPCGPKPHHRSGVPRCLPPSFRRHHNFSHSPATQAERAAWVVQTLYFVMSYVQGLEMTLNL